MRNVQPSALVQYIRRLAESQAGADDRTDRELLQLYAASRDEAAFSSLVRRYGPMVWKLCRRALRNEQDAEDAFQAAFIVLARKAGSVRWRESIASWLFAVAQRITCKARSQAIDRWVSESAEPSMPDPVEGMSAGELLAALHEELAFLPEKLRGPLILFFLESKTQEETAQLLRVSLSTVRRRLDQGRAILRARLARRGLEFSGGLLVTAVLSQNALATSVPIGLMGTTIKAVSVLAAGKATATAMVSAKVAALSEGVLKAMFLTKLKNAMIALLLVAMLGAGVGTVATNGLADPSEKAGVSKDLLPMGQPKAENAQLKKAELDLKALEREFKRFEAQQKKEFEDRKKEYEDRINDAREKFASEKAKEDIVWDQLGLKLEHVGPSEVVKANSDLYGGMRITAVRPSSLASAAGIRKGDILVGLHSSQTTTRDSVVFTLGYAKGAGMKSLRVILVREDRLCLGEFQVDWGQAK